MHPTPYVKLRLWLQPDDKWKIQLIAYDDTGRWETSWVCRPGRPLISALEVLGEDINDWHRGAANPMWQGTLFE